MDDLKHSRLLSQSSSQVQEVPYPIFQNDLLRVVVLLARTETVQNYSRLMNKQYYILPQVANSCFNKYLQNLYKILLDRVMYLF